MKKQVVCFNCGKNFSTESNECVCSTCIKSTKIHFGFARLRGLPPLFWTFTLIGIPMVIWVIVAGVICA